MKTMRLDQWLFCGAVALCVVGSAWAGEDLPATESPLDRAFVAAGKSMVRGPAEVALAGQAKLALPENYGFIPKVEATKLLQAMGNTVSPNTQGMLVPTDSEELAWFTVVSYEAEGYVSDDDAKDWDADALLKSIKEGTASDNEWRRQQGFGELEVVGWAEPPRYDAATHRLVWSVATREHDQQGGTSQGVNYRTLELGRHGFIAMNMVTGLDVLPQHKVDADNLLAALEFDAGNRYGDFNASTDKVAEYGLAALVAGVAAKKLGMLALAAAFLVKAWKLLLLAAVGAGSAMKKFFGRKSDDATVA